MYRRLISAGLSISMLFGAMAFTGCKKKTSTLEGVNKIPEDSIWFQSSTTKLGEMYQGKEFSHLDSAILGVYKDGLVIENVGEYVLPDDFDWATDNYEDYEFYNIDYYTLDGELIQSVDVRKADSDRNKTELLDIIVRDDGVNLRIRDYSNKEEKYYVADLDLQTGTIGEFVELAEDPNILAKAANGSLRTTWSIGDYLVSLCVDDSFVISHNGKSMFVDVAANPSFADLIYISSSYIALSETKILLVCLQNGIRFVSMDLQTGEVKDVTQEYSWLKTISYDTHIASFEGRSYILNQDGVKYINSQTKELEEVLSFNNCNLNRYSVRAMDLLSVKDDKFIFAGFVSEEDSTFFGDRFTMPTITVLEKAEKNPNAGKAIMTAAAIGNTEISYSICEAIRIFNETNKDYFIQLEYNYDIKKTLDYGGAESEEDHYNIYYKTAADLNDLLAINMLAGDGPDIILNAGNIRQIQTEKHLVDLSRYINGKNGINTDDYFSNIIDAAKVDDKLLYMPVSFELSGIAVNKTDIRDGQVGFTYEEYVTYTNEICNGVDPMVDTRLGVISTLFPYITETCIHGNTVNFDNESFRKLCDYVKNHVPEKSDYNYEFDGTLSYFGFGSFLYQNTYESSSITLMGYPSPDGRGPFVSVDNSIGISASAPSAIQDGAWEFIKSCLSEDAQKVIARDYTNPMSKSVFDANAKIALANYNGSEVSLGIEIDESVIDSYKDVLQSASVIESEDPAVMNVICEELPAYFLDQKSLDAVLEILKNRVTTIVNERANT
ncbi:MAG: extracellular solute-binding protein [Clostridiales bacterium]|nr:extracellular solute-binding protein [Clostridiales bacterium]